MTFYNFTDTGKTFGPYGNMLIARREARGKIAGDKRISQVEIVFSRYGGKHFEPMHKGSFYEKRAT